MQLLAQAASMAENGQVVHESGSDPSLNSVVIVMDSDSQENPESVNTDGTMTDSDSAQKALRKDIESDIVNGQDFGTRPSSPSQTEGILKQNLSRLTR